MKISSGAPSRDDLADAERWRALMRCGRIKVQGSAGVDPHTGERRNGSNVHFGAEFWPERLPDDYRAKYPEEAARYDRSTRWGVACLAALADAILECEAAEGPDEPSAAAHGTARHPLPDTPATKQVIAELCEALKPFAEANNHLHPAHPDDGVTLDGFTCLDVRRAAEVFAKYKARGAAG